MNYYEIMAGVESAKLDSELNAMKEANKSLLNQKVSKLAQRAVEKSAKLGLNSTLPSTPEFQADMLTGLSDSDTYKTQNYDKSIRASTPHTKFYDAVELKHGSNEYDMLGKDKAYRDANPNSYAKSITSMTTQRKQVADLINKQFGTNLNENTVTEQDMIDVGNMQQIQTLADAARLPGDERWQAPLIRGVEQTNLTGKGYKDEYGNLVDGTGEIPLNVPITSVDYGAIGKREGGAIGNLAGEDVTSTHALDPTLNASLYYGNQNGQTVNTGTYEERLAKLNAIDNANKGYGENIIDGLQAGVGSFLSRTGDTAVDAAARVSKGVFGNEEVNTFVNEMDKYLGKDWFSEEGDFTGLDDYKEYSEYGYNDKNVQSASNSVKKAWNSGDIGDVADAFVSVAKASPELLATSVGDMLAALAGPLGFGVWASNFNNEVLEERAKDVGGIDKLTTEDRFIAGLVSIPAAALNTATKGGLKPAIEVLKRSVNVGGKSVASIVAKKILGGALGEGAEEGVQEVLIEVGKKLNTASEDELGSDAFWENIAVSTALGAGPGGLIGTIGSVPDVVNTDNGKAIVDSAKKKVEKLTETDTQKKIRENFEYSAPLKAEASAKFSTNNADEAVKIVEDIHGKVSKDLDESAPKAFTYGIVIRDALDKAHTDNDTESIKNIYKTMAELDAREDVDFKASSVIDDRTYQATQEFIKLINTSGETAETKMQAMNLGKQAANEAADTVSTEGAKIDANILAQVKAMKDSLEQEKADMKETMGSEFYEENSKKIDKVIAMQEEYLKNKNVEAVNTEMSELGYIEKDINGGFKVDPNRPGIKSYAKELEAQLLDPKVNANLTGKKAGYRTGPTLDRLKEFAESRLTKLNKNKSYQTAKLVNQLIPENEQILSTIQNLSNTAKGLKGISDETRLEYEALLKEAEDSVINANVALTRRKEILEKVGKGPYAYQIDTDGKETIQRLVSKDERIEVATIAEDGTVKWTGEAPKKDVKPETKAQPDEVINKEDFKAEAKFTDEVVKPVIDAKQEETTEVEVKYDAKEPLKAVRAKVAKLDTELAKELADVPDMDVKAHVKAHYKKKIENLQEERNKLNALFDRIEKAIDARISRADGIDTKNPLSGLLAYADKLVKSMLNKLSDLRKKLRLNSNKHRAIENELNGLLKMINQIEQDYITKNKAQPEEVNTSIGKVTKYKDSVYGAMIETKDKRIAVTNKAKASKTDMYNAMESLKNDKIVELDAEISETNSLSAKLLKRNLERFGLGTAVHRILKQSSDSIFGKMNKDMFANHKELIEALPKSFKDFFIQNDKEATEELIKNFKTVDKFLNSMKIADIHMNQAKIGDRGVIDREGLIIKSAEKYLPIERELVSGDKLQSKDGSKVTVKKDLSNVPNNLSGYLVKEKIETSFPVDIIELIGTVKDDKLEIDEQTETILKFYAAKMVTDTQAMVGNILSMDATDMSKYLGITDTAEQEQVREDALNGLVSSASIRKDIGGEVYQALGIKFTRETPEFTEESFKSALGVLVQAAIVDSGVVSMRGSKAGGKNQNLLKVNKNVLEDMLGEEGNNDLIKAMNKLQYLNESRNRPLPSFKKLKPAKSGERFVMNTSIAIDDVTSAKMDKLEETSYTISDRFAKYLDMDEDTVLEAMGYKDTEIAGLHVSEMSAQQARNDKLVREWDILKTFAKASKGKKFYVPWGETVSGRFTILSDLQYQESKLHREFVVADGSVETVDPKSVDDVEQLKASILQGLDMDPDKLSPETAHKKFDEAFKVTDKGIEVVKEGPIKTAYEAMKKGEIDAEAMAEVFDDSEGHHGISSIELLVDWNNALRDGTKIKTHANVEIDAITSGMILTLLQIGTDKAIEMAEKGGIYTAERMPVLKKYVEHWLGKETTFTPGALIEAGKAHAAVIEAGSKATAKQKKLLKGQETDLQSDTVFKDLYSTIGVAMINEVQTYKTKLKGLEKPTNSEVLQLAMLEEIGELNLKNIRSIAKSPVMVYIYGASTASIKKKLTYSLGVDTLVKAIKTAAKTLGKDKLTDEDNALVAEKGKFINAFIPVEDRVYVDMFGKKLNGKDLSAVDKLLHLEISEAVIEKIGKVINATFGTAIETAFESRLGFVDENRDAVKSVEMLTFEAYKMKLADAIRTKLNGKYGKGKHNGESYKLSKADLVEINAKLTDEGYGHTITWKDDNRTREQSLQKTSTKGGMHSSKVTVGSTSVGGQIKEATAEVNTGAASTIPIHAIDGDMILETLTRELEGKLTGKYTGGNVYDAVVLSVNKAMLENTADFYNTGMIETGFSRSIMADQLDKLETMLSGLAKEGLLNEYVARLGLRPEGENATNYSKEMLRLKLSVSKMLQRIELAEKRNDERIANSAKGYGSGHLYQMGSNVVDIASAEARAKVMPRISRLTSVLKKVIADDRVQTAKEFGNKIESGVDYVLDLNDFIKGANVTKSAANLGQFTVAKNKDGNPITDWKGRAKLAVDNKLWLTLTDKDTVQIIGGDYTKTLEQLESKGNKLAHAGSAAWQLKTIITELNKSTANIIDNTNAVKQVKDVKSEEIKKPIAEVLGQYKKEIGKMGVQELIEKAQECAKG